MFPQSYTKALRIYDSALFVARTTEGKLCVFRKTKRFVPVCEIEGTPLLSLIEDKQYVFALTDTWTPSGNPIPWGIDTVVGRVRELDFWANKRLVEELDAANEVVDERKQRHLKNEMEAFWSDNRERVKKATGEIMTHSLSKDDKRKRLQDRSIKK